MLVSIVVITYNSAEHILEMLDSARNQSYRDLELIISDDASSDGTTHVCQRWLEKNGSRFIRTKLVTVERNTGIPANCNRGVKAARGIWIKIFAGDDILDPECVQNFIDFSIQNSEASVISSSTQMFTNQFSKENFTRLVDISKIPFFNEDLTPAQQYNMLLRRNYVLGPSTFIKKAAIESVNGYDEKFYFEDYPMFLKLTKAGYKIYGLDKITVYYRKHNSVSLSYNGNALFGKMYLWLRPIEVEYIFPYITRKERISRNIEFYRLRLFQYLKLNRNNFICRNIFNLSDRINPGSRIIKNALEQSMKIQK